MKFLYFSFLVVVVGFSFIAVDCDSNTGDGGGNSNENLVNKVSYRHKKVNALFDVNELEYDDSTKTYTGTVPQTFDMTNDANVDLSFLLELLLFSNPSVYSQNPDDSTDFTEISFDSSSPISLPLKTVVSDSIKQFTGNFRVIDTSNPEVNNDYKIVINVVDNSNTLPYYSGTNPVSSTSLGFKIVDSSLKAFCASDNLLMPQCVKDNVLVSTFDYNSDNKSFVYTVPYFYKDSTTPLPLDLNELLLPYGASFVSDSTGATALLNEDAKKLNLPDRDSSTNARSLSFFVKAQDGTVDEYSFNHVLGTIDLSSNDSLPLFGLRLKEITDLVVTNFYDEATTSPLYIAEATVLSSSSKSLDVKGTPLFSSITAHSIFDVINHFLKKDLTTEEFRYFIPRRSHFNWILTVGDRRTKLYPNRQSVVTNWNGDVLSSKKLLPDPFNQDLTSLASYKMDFAFHIFDDPRDWLRGSLRLLDGHTGSDSNVNKFGAIISLYLELKE